MLDKTKLLRGGFVVLLFLLTLCISVSTSGQTLAAQRPTSSTIAISSHVVANSAASVAATQKYWTTERMKTALSGDLLLSGAKHAPQQTAPKGVAGSHAPVAPQTASKANAVTPHLGVTPNAYALGYPYAFPYSTVGKVFFTDSRTGFNYVCSGTAVNSNNLSTVDTAGHCVAAGGSGNNWYTNWAFCAQYFYGCPAGDLWTARTLVTLTTWINNGWFEEDYGAAVVSPNSRGLVVNAIGGAGWAYNQSYYQAFYAFGFPAAAPFDGGRLWYCGSYLYRLDNPSPGTSSALGITCDMTGGSSGGGWLISIGNTFGYVNGHNDYKYNNDPNHMYSPYYNGDWFAVFNTAQNL